jgi:methyltransferase
MTVAPGVLLAAIALAFVVVMMLGELRLSKANERALRAQGAIDAPDDVYAVMTWVYPACFVAMAIEGAIVNLPPGMTTLAGVAVLLLAKSIKFWAIGSLGVRWTYKVLVLPGVPLVTSGPYRYLRHPNYVAVIGELLGMALLVGARVTAAIAVIAFGFLLRRRIAAEERALQTGLIIPATRENLAGSRRRPSANG